MEKSTKNSSAHDIAQEQYQGPSVVAAATGEGVVAHFLWALIGLVGGSVAAWFGFKHLQPMIGKFRDTGTDLIANRERGLFASVSRGCGRLIHSIFGHGPLAKGGKIPQALRDKVYAQYEHGFGLWLANHTFGLIPSVKKSLGKVLEADNSQAERLSTALTGGGIFAFFGYFILPVLLMFKGAKTGERGREQFEQAKEEIWAERTAHEKLREKYVEVRTELEELRAIKAMDTANGKDDEPVMQGESLLTRPTAENIPTSWVPAENRAVEASHPVPREKLERAEALAAKQPAPAEAARA